jgi:hypothetical protein
MSKQVSRDRREVRRSDGAAECPKPPAPSVAIAAAHNPAYRGYVILYREGMAPHCPGCGGIAWLVGRTLAECARCATAVPMEAPASFGSGAIRVRSGSNERFVEMAA